jgi:hypothetical protein
MLFQNLCVCGGAAAVVWQYPVLFAHNVWFDMRLSSFECLLYEKVVGVLIDLWCSLLSLMVMVKVTSVLSLLVDSFGFAYALDVTVTGLDNAL